MSYFRITSILHSGNEGKRGTPRTDGRYPLRVGRIVSINERAMLNGMDIRIGWPFYIVWVTDENGNDYRGHYKRTSYVVDWDYTFENRIRIETYCTIYEFERVDEEEINYGQSS